LMTTSWMDMLKEDHTTPAIAFDRGAGRVDLRTAPLAGLVLDESTADFLDADPGAGGFPTDLNIASFADNQCLQNCVWDRVVKNTQAVSVTWTASIDAPAGITLTVTPASFEIGPNAEQMITVHADATAATPDQWHFGDITLTPSDASIPDAHFPVAVYPTLGIFPETIQIETRRNAGSQLVEDVQSIEITSLTVDTHGLVQADLDTFYLYEDPTNDSPIDDLDQVYLSVVDVPAGAKRLVAEILDSEAPDVDLFVYNPSLVCSSTTGSWQEYCNLDDPAEGTYYIVVQNWAGSATQPDKITLATGVVPGEDAGNMAVEGPVSVPALTPFDLRVYWDTPEMMAGDRWYGALTLGTDPSNFFITIPVDIHRSEDDVYKTAMNQPVKVGDQVDFVVAIRPNVTPTDLNYIVQDNLPEGLTLVPGSIEVSHGTVSVLGLSASGDAGNGTNGTGTTLVWRVTNVVPEYDYVMSTSATDPWCDTGFGGYVDLEGFGIKANASIVGDTDYWTAFSTANPVNFYGTDYDRVGFTDDGFVVFDPANNWGTGAPPWTPQLLPNVDAPNNLIAGLWQDMEIFYDAALNYGVSLATAGPDTRIIEYDNAQYYGGSAEMWDYEYVIYSQDDTPGAYEFIVAYDNLSEVTGPLTVGVENVDGTKAQALVNNDDATGALSDGFMVCYDYQAIGADGEWLKYSVTVDDGAALGDIFSFNIQSQTDNPGDQPATFTYKLPLGLQYFLPLIYKP